MAFRRRRSKRSSRTTTKRRSPAAAVASLRPLDGLRRGSTSASFLNTLRMTRRLFVRLLPSKRRRRERREGKNVVIERIYQKTERTPEEQARIRDIREKFQREKPSLDDLLATSDYDGPIPQGAYLELRRLMHLLRKERERLG